jgi:hypothetical protein
MCAKAPAIESNQSKPAGALPSPAETASCTWRVVGAAVQGVGHQRQGLPCQDAQDHRVVQTEHGQALLVALADGAGSAEHADLGASCAVEVALYILESVLADQVVAPEDDECLIRTAFAGARHYLKELAEQEGIPFRSLATTLTCAMVMDGRLVTGQLGDGVVVVQSSREEFIAITQPQRGEYANETYFLTQDNASDRVQIQMFDQPVQALALMSDGLLRLAMRMPNNEPHLPFFKPLFSFVSTSEDQQAAADQLADFLNSERVCARTDDDKSLILAIYSPTQITSASTNG